LFRHCPMLKPIGQILSIGIRRGSFGRSRMWNELRIDRSDRHDSTNLPIRCSGANPTKHRWFKRPARTTCQRLLPRGKRDGGRSRRGLCPHNAIPQIVGRSRHKSGSARPCRQACAHGGDGRCRAGNWSFGQPPRLNADPRSQDVASTREDLSRDHGDAARHCAVDEAIGDVNIRHRWPNPGIETANISFADEIRWPVEFAWSQREPSDGVAKA
jgi:hypothetical protein